MVTSADSMWRGSKDMGREGGREGGKEGGGEMDKPHLDASLYLPT